MVRDTAGTTFKFEIDPGCYRCHGDETWTTTTSVPPPPGCDMEAGAGQELELRVVVDGGGEAAQPEDRVNHTRQVDNVIAHPRGQTTGDGEMRCNRA